MGSATARDTRLIYRQCHCLYIQALSVYTDSGTVPPRSIFCASTNYKDNLLKLQVLHFVNFMAVNRKLPLRSAGMSTKIKVKVSHKQAEVAQGVPCRLRPRIISTFGTTRVVGRQPYAPAAFTPGEIPGTHGFVGRNHGKNPK